MEKSIRNYKGKNQFNEENNNDAERDDKEQFRTIHGDTTSTHGNKKGDESAGETGILSMREKRPQTLVIDDSHAREPSGLVRLSKTAAWIALILHPSEKAILYLLFCDPPGTVSARFPLTEGEHKIGPSWFQDLGYVPDKTWAIRVGEGMEQA